MDNNELLQAIRQIVQEEVKPLKLDIEGLKNSQSTMQTSIEGLKRDQSAMQTSIEGLKRGQSKMQAQMQGVKAEMHERFDKLETVTEYALREIDYLEQAYKAL